jgi:hypothetical protein
MHEITEYRVDRQRATVRLVIQRREGAGNTSTFETYMDPDRAARLVLDLARVTADARDIAAELAERPCADCGHGNDQHQSGEGPWTGFCGTPECDCERYA